MTTAQISLPPKLVSVFSPPRGSVRYRAAYGGRGSGKSHTFALMAAVFGYAEPLRILCTRELQVSIRESMYAEIRTIIQSYPWLLEHYEIGESFIRGANGTEFLFRGIRHNISSIKSMSQIDLCLIEEAEDVPQQSWQELLPTIRAPKSEIWSIHNPRMDGSPVDQRFIKNPPDDAIVAALNWWDNPWFPDVLDNQRRHDQERMDPATYAHVWEGAYLQNSDSQILAGKVFVREFDPDWKKWDGPYYGGDWGFAQDPTAVVECWIYDDRLWVRHEAGGVGIEYDEVPERVLNIMPEAEKYVIRWDAANPGQTSHVAKKGLRRSTSAPKWQGSVEDGISHLRSYKEIVIHPECKNIIKESRLYSYKVDRHTGDILPVIVDAHNHYIDAIRYALSPMIQGKKNIPIDAWV